MRFLGKRAAEFVGALFSRGAPPSDEQAALDAAQRLRDYRILAETPHGSRILADIARLGNVTSYHGEGFTPNGSASLSEIVLLNEGRRSLAMDILDLALSDWAEIDEAEEQSDG